MATMANAVSLPETIAKAYGQGKSRNEIVKNVANSGVHPQAAQAMVDGALRAYPSLVRSGALAQMGTGTVLLAIGLIVTMGTLAMASSGAGGGFFIVSGGPIVFGTIRILRGLFRLMSA